MMTERIHRDLTAVIEKSGIFLEATYDCHYNLTTERIDNGDKRTELEWIECEVIRVSYGDDNDNEYQWMYGENMPPRIYKALDTYAAEINRQLTEKAMEYR